MKSGMLAADALYLDLLKLPTFTEEEAEIVSHPVEVSTTKEGRHVLSHF